MFRRLNNEGVQEGADYRFSETVRDSAIAWNGTHFLVAFVDTMSRLMVQRFDAIGGRVDQRPEIAVNTQYVAWSERTSADRVLHLAPVAGGPPTEVARQTVDPSGMYARELGLTARSVFYNAYGYAPSRMRMRPFLDTGLGASCAAPSDCDSNFCVLGVCCNAACGGACDVCSAAGMCTPMMCDAGMADAGLSDAGVSDAGLSDAGLSDASTEDAAIRADDSGAHAEGWKGSGCGRSRAPSSVSFSRRLRSYRRSVLSAETLRVFAPLQGPRARRLSSRQTLACVARAQPTLGATSRAWGRLEGQE